MPSPPALPSVGFPEIVQRYLPGLPGEPRGGAALADVAERQLLVCHALLARELAGAAGEGEEARGALREAEALGRLIALLGHGVEARAARRQRLEIETAKARVRRVEHQLRPKQPRYHQYDPDFEAARAKIIAALPDACFAGDDGVRDEEMVQDVLFGMPLWMARALRGYAPVQGTVGPFRTMEEACIRLDWPRPPKPRG